MGEDGVTLGSIQTTLDHEEFAYQMASGAAAAHAVRGRGISGTSQAVTGANWTGQDEQSVEMGRRRVTVTSTTNASTDAEGVTGGVSTVTTDLFEKSHYEVGAGVGNGNGVARAHGTQFGAEGTRLLNSLDIVTITLHADGKTSKYRGFHETRSETSTQEFTLTGGQGGSLTDSTFGMGMFNVFHRDKTTSLTELIDVDGVLTRDDS